MNFIIPIGRTLEIIAHLRACMCASAASFQIVRGNDDSCAHCGCHCASGNNLYFNANHHIVRTANLGFGLYSLSISNIAYVHRQLKKELK